MTADLSSQRVRPGGNKTNSDHVVYATKDGGLEFGHLHLQGGGKGQCDVTSGVLLHTYDTRHYMTMDIEAPRNGWTIFNSPGPFQVRSAIDDAGVVSSGSIPGGDNWSGAGIFLLSENGDVVIRAPKGRVRISALDIDIRAEGPNNNKGTINLDSNETVNIKTGKFNVTAEKGVKIFTPKTLQLVADTSFEFATLFCKGLSSASAVRPSKDLPTTTEQFNNYTEMA